jgi:cobyrinic acid a,c-diamide synthase
MRDIGLEPAFFSPLADRRLPAGASGLYLGGGYPELNAERLSRNDAMRDSIRRAAASGMPVFAECGGYLYLLESLEDMEGRVWPGCAVLPGRAVMGKGLAGLGYREARTGKDGVLGPAGTALVGHVFHYSRVEGARGDLAMRPARGGDEELDGSISGSVLGSYLHLHFAGNRGALENFAAACSAYRAIALGDGTAGGAS